MNLKKIALLLDIAAFISLILYAFVENDIVDWACIIIFFLAICCEIAYKLSLKNRN